MFEPTVMFSGLTNSLATFQTIINKILWDLINSGEVASFINNVIVETERKEAWWSGRRSSKNVGRKWFTCKTREVQVKDQWSKIFRSGNCAGRDKIAEKKIKVILN